MAANTGGNLIRPWSKAKLSSITAADASPLISSSAERVLRDEQRTKKLVVTFCDGIFSYADERTASQIIDESLKLCGGNKDVLAQVVQTKFFAGHTPFYWLLVNRHSKPKTPPFLEKLFQLCKDVASETLEDMTKGLPHRLDDDLYKIVKRYVTPQRQRLNRIAATAMDSWSSPYLFSLTGCLWMGK
jgi:hypothetical protein